MLVAFAVGVGFGPPVPLPDRRIFCGLFIALSVMNTNPSIPPLRCAMKLTLTVHWPPIAKVGPQVVVIGNTAGLLEVIPAIVIGTGSLFVRVVVLLLVGSAPHEWVLGNFSKPQDYAEFGRAHGLMLVKEFANGVVLYRQLHR